MASGPVLALPSEAPGLASARSVGVLVAEDEPMFRRMFESWLQQWGYRVTLAEDGAAAWRELQTEARPRLLLLDWMMPGLDGVEVCRRVRALQHESYSYIIVVTARASKQDVVDALNAGADDYITKPVEANELRARVQAAGAFCNCRTSCFVRASSCASRPAAIPSPGCGTAATSSRSCTMNWRAGSEAECRWER